MSSKKVRCLNPYLHDTPCNRDNLRKVSNKISEILTIKEGSWLCSVCRKICEGKVKEFEAATNLKGK